MLRRERKRNGLGVHGGEAICLPGLTARGPYQLSELQLAMVVAYYFCCHTFQPEQSREASRGQSEAISIARRCERFVIVCLS